MTGHLVPWLVVMLSLIFWPLVFAHSAPQKLFFGEMNSYWYLFAVAGWAQAVVIGFKLYQTMQEERPGGDQLLKGVCGPLGEAADPARYGSAPACVKTTIGELFHQIFQSGEYFPHLSERFSQECRSGESPDRRGAWRA